MKKKKFFKLCVRALTGQISLKEREILNAWLQQSPENRDYFDRLEKTWSDQKFPTLPFEPDLDKAWLEFEQALKGASNKRRSFPVLVNIGDTLEGWFGFNYRGALITGLALCVLVFTTLFFKTELFRTRYHSVITRNNQTVRLTLIDGSQVRLNNGSSIRYLKKFPDSHREIMLAGEAFFEVSQEERPFSVVTKYAKTTVLGTEFNVWARGEKTRVIVKEGRVRLGSLMADSSHIELTKGQMSQIIGQQPPESPGWVDADYLLGWLSGQLVFRIAPLEEITAELERKYDVSVVLGNSALADMTLTAEFADGSIEEILTSICLTLNIRYTVDSGQYILMSEPE